MAKKKASANSVKTNNTDSNTNDNIRNNNADAAAATFGTAAVGLPELKPIKPLSMPRENNREKLRQLLAAKRSLRVGR